MICTADNGLKTPYISHNFLITIILIRDAWQILNWENGI